MKKYEFTGKTIQFNGYILRQIIRVKDKLVGGWIESELNLSQDGKCFVYGDAKVYENANVSGDASVSGNAIVFITPVCVTGLKHNITVTETHIFIGCEGHTKQFWRKEIVNIGKKHNYTNKEINRIIKLLKQLI